MCVCVCVHLDVGVDVWVDVTGPRGRYVGGMSVTSEKRGCINHSISPQTRKPGSDIPKMACG